jgi:4-amino-4-deoxy-L-arabinose transferase-like glycosyltransferase
MLPEPLHPAVVHFPIAFVVLLPIVALIALWAIRRGAPPRRVWAVPLLLAALLAGSAWAALRTGEKEEGRVEGVVGEAALHRHEESAERFLVLSGVLLLVTSVGVAGGVLGRAGRLVATVGSIGLLVAGVQTGASGGDLVYRHGAARAYADQPVGGTGPAVQRETGREDHD